MLVAIFLMSGFQHDWQLPNTVAYFGAKGLPAPEVGAVIAITIEVGAGLMVLSGWNARWGALAIAIFSILTSLLFHAYWSEPLPARMSDFINFWKNVSIAGGFLMVFAFGPGRYSYRRSAEVV